MDGEGRSGVGDVEGWKGGREDGLAEVDVFAGGFWQGLHRNGNLLVL